jgi:hypothetical protein
MSLLNFDSKDDQPPRNRKSLKLVLGVSTLVGVVALGSTLAASINLNGGGPVEFGQGVTQTTACDDDITVTPFSTFVNETGAGSHKFTSLEISGIDSSSDKCDGKTFIIKAYGDSGQLDFFSYADSANPEENDSYDTIEIANDGGDYTWISGGSDGNDVIAGPDIGITETSFTLSFTSAVSTITRAPVVNTITRTPLASAEDVVRITIESSKIEAISLAREFPCGTSGFYAVNEFGVLTGHTDCLGSLIIDDSVVEIAVQVFYHRSGITSIVIPDSVLVIGPEAFNSMPDLISLDIGDGVTEIGSYLFADSTQLSSVMLGSGITHLRRGAFYNTAISNIVLPWNLLSIAADAFNTTQLYCVDIPGTVEFIDPYAFDSELPSCGSP